ncbi:MAG TPA: cation:proton antiporter [Quisquiliibacterium sp.]|nr:MAG: potassium transporter [Burkholderiaceae bacterium]HOA92736.1 cation:proton antiporter [Quisquiliibacterium sp.]HPA88563.1 cation:proton antiporter [Quisquiliibacterium sp.]HQN10859.1 cation:proton antiporter [Quisquiliibacterium sp.]HQP65212.1 cation:proton antiporter [Quisquiliibacterium sp.]
MLSSLEIALVLLAASVIAVVALRALNLPPLVAYLAVGALLGPHATNMAGEPEAVRHAGELGVVFLMFTLGLEFNLGKLTAMRALVFGLGAAQVAVTMVLVVAVFVVLPAAGVLWLLGGAIDWRAALVLGGAVAMSSTAMVTKLLAEKRELDSEHGRRVFSVLLFQDIAVIPLLILIPALAAGGDAWIGAVGLAALKAVVVLVLLIRFGPWLMKRWFNIVARQRSHELFTLNVLLATLLFAWLTKMAGLSMELGAFVAGMLISETAFRFQVEEDIKPFRDVLLGLFFVSIGAQLDLRVVAEFAPQVLLLAIVPILLKFGLVVGLVRAFGASAGVAIRTGVWLAQAGEFGFVLLALAGGVGLIPAAALQPVLAAMLISMLVSPLLIEQANRIAIRLSGEEWMLRSLQLQTIASRSLARDRHVIVCGYGRCGQALAHVLEAEKVGLMALDLDPDRVREAAATGESVVYGDSARRETLVAVGVHRARALAVTFDDTAAALRVIRTARELAPQLPILVRTAHETDIERLRAAGATEIVPEIVEGSLMLASHALALAGVPMARVLRRVRTVREGRYSLLRGFFRGADDAGDDAIESAQVHLRAVGIAQGSALVACPVGSLPLGGARVSTVVRASQRIVDPPPDMTLQAGDTVVLAGTLEQISAGEDRLLRA